MATASANRMMLWTDLEGRELMGRWRLARLVRPEGRNAWFEATGPDGKPAMVSLTEALNDEDELLARLKAASMVRHRNVVAVREAHLTHVEDTPVVLAAMEPTDENLADVLRERTLNAAEALPLMDALVQGLAAIHARRLSHGRMEPASVVAMGDTVKLRSDCLQVEGFSARAGEDVRGLGRIVTQALTRRVPAGENDPVLQLLPEPLGRAVRRALSGTATVEEIAALAGTKIVAVAAPVPVGREPVAETKLAAETKPVAGGQRVAGSETKLVADGTLVAGSEPVVKAAPVIAPAMTEAAKAGGQMDLPLIPRRAAAADLEDDEDGPGAGAWNWEKWEQAWDRLRTRKYHRVGAPWIVGAAAILALATVLVVHGLMHRASPAASPAAVASAAGSVAPQTAVVAPRAAARRTQRVEAAGAAATTAAAAGPAARGAHDWRVVVYTYRRRSEAEQKAASIGKRHPELEAGVLATRGGAYLVTVGGAMTREEAFAERGRAVRMGMPRDSYAQNFR